MEVKIVMASLVMCCIIMCCVFIHHVVKLHEMTKDPFKQVFWACVASVLIVVVVLVSWIAQRILLGS